MRIKHWQGYGCLNAKSIKNTKKQLIIEVIGNHEYGLDCGSYDKYRVYEWLVKRFKRNVESYQDIERYDVYTFFQRNEEKHIDEEHAIYTIYFR